MNARGGEVVETVAVFAGVLRLLAFPDWRVTAAVYGAIAAGALLASVWWRRSR